MEEGTVLVPQGHRRKLAGGKAAPAAAAPGCRANQQCPSGASKKCFAPLGTTPAANDSSATQQQRSHPGIRTTQLSLFAKIRAVRTGTSGSLSSVQNGGEGRGEEALSTGGPLAMVKHPSPRPSPRSCLTGRGRRTRFFLRQSRHGQSQRLIAARFHAGFFDAPLGQRRIADRHRGPRPPRRACPRLISCGVPLGREQCLRPSLPEKSSAPNSFRTVLRPRPRTPPRHAAED